MTKQLQKHYGPEAASKLRAENATLRANIEFYKHQIGNLRSALLGEHGLCPMNKKCDVCQVLHDTDPK